MKSNARILQHLVAQGLTSQEMNVYLDKIDGQVQDLLENDQENEALCLREKQTKMLLLAFDIIITGQTELLRRIKTAPENPFRINGERFRHHVGQGDQVHGTSRVSSYFG